MRGRGGKYPPPKHVDPTKDESDSDEVITNEENDEVDMVEIMNEMPVPRRRRVYALKFLTAEFRKLHREFMQELAACELKALAEDQQLFDDRRRIVNGERDITEAEAAAIASKAESGVEEIPSDDDDASKDDALKKKTVQIKTAADEANEETLAGAANSPTGGIPNFWLVAMKNNEVVEGMITERDEAALKHLTDITVQFIDGQPRKGFELHFYFSPNEYFTDAVLTKRYIMQDDEKTQDEEDDTLDVVEGCEIHWTSPEKKLTVVIKQKKQRHKSGKGVRVVQREEKCPSFFHFFTAPKEPDEENEEEEDEEEISYEDQLEMDYEAGLAFRQGLIPRAAHYYSGKSVEEIASGLNFPMGAESGEDNDGDEEDEEEEEEETKGPRITAGRGGGAPPPAKRGGMKQPADCKQQ